MQRTVEYEDIVVGSDLGQYRLLVSPGWALLRFIEPTDDYHPWYQQDSPFGGPILPPWGLTRQVLALVGVQQLFRSLGGAPVIHARQELELKNPLRVSKKVVVRGRLANKYIRRGKEYVIFEALSVDEDGVEILQSRGIYCWPAPGIPLEPPGSAARERPEAKAPVASEAKGVAPSAEGAQVGQELPPVTKTLTLEASQAFSGWPDAKSYHTDEELAHQAGFPTVLAEGTLGAAYICQMCMRFLEEGWLRGGMLAVTHIGRIHPPMHLTARGRITEKVPEGDRTRLMLEVWLEDEAGQKIQVGSASGLVLPPG